MSIDQNEVPQIQKYLDEGNTIHTLIHLRPPTNSKQREMLAITSSSVVKYTRNGPGEMVNIVFLRHVTGLRLTVDRFNLGRLIAGVILLTFGVTFSIMAAIPTYTYSEFLGEWYYAYYFTGYLWLAIPFFIGALGLIITAYTGRGGTLRIHSYNAAPSIVDARFAWPMVGTITKVAQDLQRIVALGGRGTPAGQPAVKPPPQQPEQPAAQPMPAQPTNAAGLRIASGPVYPPNNPAPSVENPAVEPTLEAKPPEGTGDKKRCSACGALIPVAQQYCQDCGSKQ